MFIAALNLVTIIIALIAGRNSVSRGYSAFQAALRS